MPGFVIFLSAVAVISVILAVRRRGVANGRLEHWANENGYELLFQQRRTLFQGPFVWTSSKHQIIYEIKVRDRDGNFRGGYVRVGGWFLGMMSDNLEVRWNDACSKSGTID